MARSALKGRNHHEADAGVSGDPFDKRLSHHDQLSLLGGLLG